MKRGLLICAGLLALCSFGEIEVGGLPGWELADTEVSTNVPFALPRENVKHLVFTLALAGTPSNNVQVAFGTDSNTNGVLEVDEVGLDVGWDCGVWVMRTLVRSGDGVMGRSWQAEPVTTNALKELTFDLSVSRAKPKRLASAENGVSLDWQVPGILPRELYDRVWDTLKLTVRGVDAAEESLRARVCVEGVKISIL